MKNIVAAILAVACVAFAALIGAQAFGQEVQEVEACAVQNVEVPQRLFRYGVRTEAQPFSIGDLPKTLGTLTMHLPRGYQFHTTSDYHAVCAPDKKGTTLGESQCDFSRSDQHPRAFGAGVLVRQTQAWTNGRWQWFIQRDDTAQAVSREGWGRVCGGEPTTDNACPHHVAWVRIVPSPTD